MIQKRLFELKAVLHNSQRIAGFQSVCKCLSVVEECNDALALKMKSYTI